MRQLILIILLLSSSYCIAQKPKLENISNLYLERGKSKTKIDKKASIIFQRTYDEDSLKVTEMIVGYVTEYIDSTSIVILPISKSVFKSHNKKLIEQSVHKFEKGSFEKEMTLNLREFNLLEYQSKFRLKALLFLRNVGSIALVASVGSILFLKSPNENENKLEITNAIYSQSLLAISTFSYTMTAFFGPFNYYVSSCETCSKNTSIYALKRKTK